MKYWKTKRAKIERPMVTIIIAIRPVFRFRKGLHRPTSWAPPAKAQISTASRAATKKGTPFVFIAQRSEEHTSELQSLMRISYAVFCLKKTTTNKYITQRNTQMQNNDTMIITTTIV